MLPRVTAQQLFGQMCWALCRPFIPCKTREKIGIYGSSGWTEEMLELIPDVLTHELTRQCLMCVGV